MKTVNRSSRMMSSTSLTKLGYAGAPLSSVPSLALEPRFMFDAAGAVTGIEAAQDTVAETEAQEEGNRMLETIARERAEREGPVLDLDPKTGKNDYDHGVKSKADFSKGVPLIDPEIGFQVNIDNGIYQMTVEVKRAIGGEQEGPFMSDMNLRLGDKVIGENPQIIEINGVTWYVSGTFSERGNEFVYVFLPLAGNTDAQTGLDSAKQLLEGLNLHNTGEHDPQEGDRLRAKITVWDKDLDRLDAGEKAVAYSNMAIGAVAPITPAEPITPTEPVDPIAEETKEPTRKRVNLVQGGGEVKPVDPVVEPPVDPVTPPVGVTGGGGGGTGGGGTGGGGTGGTSGSADAGGGDVAEPGDVVVGGDAPEQVGPGSVEAGEGFTPGDLVIMPTVEGMRNVVPGAPAEALALRGAVLADSAGLEIDTAAGEEIPTEEGVEGDGGEAGVFALEEEALDDALEEVEDAEMLPEEDQGRVGALDQPQTGPGTAGAGFGEALRQAGEDDDAKVRDLARALAGRKPTVEGS